MKTILCYGDSNTWGHNPRTGLRYDHRTRWTLVLKQLLNEGAAVGIHLEPEDHRKLAAAVAEILLNLS
jgi:lysophospholipase L1-like esterase